jgi:hypothetical protein
MDLGTSEEEESEDEESQEKGSEEEGSISDSTSGEESELDPVTLDLEALAGARRCTPLSWKDPYFGIRTDSSDHSREASPAAAWGGRRYASPPKFRGQCGNRCNYRGELLGAVMALLIIRAAGIGLTGISPVLHCDNRGVVTHGNKSCSALPQKQEQADLIRSIKYLVVTNLGSARWEWVEGHAIEKKGWAQSTLPERLTDQADKLAKGVLEAVIAGGAITEGDLPLKILRLSVAGVRVTGSPRIVLETAWGYQAAKALFDAKDLVREENFHLVWWAGMGAAMAQYPKMYRVWITEHVSDFCGNNVQLYFRSNGNCSPKCESCGVED